VPYGCLFEKLFGGYIVNGEECELDFRDIRRRMVSLQNKYNSYDALGTVDVCLARIQESRKHGWVRGAFCTCYTSTFTIEVRLVSFSY
jgi:hypothetical protein